MSMSYTQVRNLMGVPSDAKMAGSSLPRFSVFMVIQFVGQTRAHWAQPMQSSILLKSLARERSGIVHFTVGY